MRLGAARDLGVDLDELDGLVADRLAEFGRAWQALDLPLGLGDTDPGSYLDALHDWRSKLLPHYERYSWVPAANWNMVGADTVG
jgi:hypothetical protein